MSEQKIPIPAMLYNSAVGGHVTNSQQIIDEDYNLEQKDVNKEVLGVPYNVSNPNGMGRIVLKKTDNFKEVVEAQTNGNTIFVIRYDFILTADTTLPNNCILLFKGGSINCSNYTISGNKMPTNVVYTPEQFGAGKTSDDTLSIQSAVNICKYIKMEGTYNVYATNGQYIEGLSTTFCINVPSNTTIYQEGTINYLSTNLDAYAIFGISAANNITIKGNGKYVGDRLIHQGSTGEWGYAIHIDGYSAYEDAGSSNITVDGGEYYNFWGDGIYIGYRGISHDIKIKNVTIHDFRRQGISVCAGHHIEIDNAYIYDRDTSYTAGGASIDFEVHWEGREIHDIILKNSILAANNSVFNTNNRTDATKIYNVVVENCSFAGILSLYDCDSSFVIRNCTIYHCYVRFHTSYKEGNIPSIYNSNITEQLGVEAPVNVYQCNIQKIYTSSAAYTTITIPANFYNCNVYNINTNISVRFNYYCCNIIIASGYNAWSLIGKFNNCNIELGNNLYAQIEAINCNISLGMESSEASWAFASYGTKLYGCTIKIANGGTYMYAFYNTNPIIILGCTIIDEMNGRYKQTGTGTIYNAGTTYINKDANGDYIYTESIMPKLPVSVLNLSGTNGNFAGFDANGNLVDSGNKPSDFEPAQS